VTALHCRHCYALTQNKNGSIPTTHLVIGLYGVKQSHFEGNCIEYLQLAQSAMS
jgi:hypothetical protein